MSSCNVLARRPREGVYQSGDRAREVQLGQNLADLREKKLAKKWAYTRALGKLRVFPDQENLAVTADRSSNPSAFWLVAADKQGGDKVSEMDRELMNRSWRGISSRPLSVKSPSEPEAMRVNSAALRDKFRATHPIYRCSSCGWSQIGEVGVSKRADGRLVVSSVATCGSVWGCPYCARSIKGGRAEEIKAIATAHDLAFGTAARSLLTLSIRHHAEDNLSDLVEGYQRAWNRFMTRVPSADKFLRKTLRTQGMVGDDVPDKLLDRMGLHGYVYGAEVTIGKNGWHYHRHVLMFFNKEVENLDCYEVEMSVWWRECVLVEMGKDHVPSLERGARLTRGKSDYLSKLGLEISEVGLKAAKNGNLTPWGLGMRASEGSGSDLDLWRQYQFKMKGKKCVQISDGLLVLMRKFGVRSEPEDGALADESRGAELVLEVPRDVWRIWRQSGSVVMDLVAGIERVKARLDGIHSEFVGKSWGGGDRALDELCRRRDAAEQFSIDIEAGRRGERVRERRERLRSESIRWKKLVDVGLLG